MEIYGEDIRDLRIVEIYGEEIRGHMRYTVRISEDSGDIQ